MEMFCICAGNLVATSHLDVWGTWSVASVTEELTF